ncbi:hypothetical protein BTO30_11215 [Domibacillus antri]|uniref:Uncharacterized protein n=1 Tax=Domibacillus antri TaxID=1714264 RepID=A0A1Q8Q454_9BACI|nr:hypothetical protein [Domibacillus antri]OLN22136.1 hypothetical protein BTO30_11215 [Domibacillus antri]
MEIMVVFMLAAAKQKKGVGDLDHTSITKTSFCDYPFTKGGKGGLVAAQTDLAMLCVNCSILHSVLYYMITFTE